ncbi:MAG: sugar ABC transporter ATP-binding protein [Phycisphaerales bacterium]|nr:sugar ABC transporter ATP-binding protein [Phycisphaerales bacterium]
MTTAGAYLLEARGIRKRFPGVQALGGVDVQVRGGEVLAVIGENGAGKSTLMRILAGADTPDAGALWIDGREVAFRGRGPIDAIRGGVALIHQELELCDNLDVASNIVLGREPAKGPWLRSAEAHRQAREVLARVGLELNPRTSLEGIGVGHRQLVEIAKALSANARILIMDEPTSSLTLREADRLFDVVAELRDRGVAIVYISHRLGEVERIADRVHVLRDGMTAGTLDRKEISHDAMVRLMVGRSVDRVFDRTRVEPGNPRLELQDFRSAAFPTYPVNLRVRAGEIVGLAGLVGSGRTELLRSIYGIDRSSGGDIRINGEVETIGNPRQAMAHGVAMVPEDRKLDGVFLEESIRENVVVSMLRRLGWGGVFRQGHQEQRVSDKVMHDLGIRAPSDRVLVGGLSGGNQQKVALGRRLAWSPQALLLDEPTRGVDVGAKADIYALMEKMARDGVGILFASSEMEEVLAIADRILVMHEGRLAGELHGPDADEESIMRLATGGEVAA